IKLEQVPPPDQRVGLVPAAEKLGGRLEVRVAVAERRRDQLRVRPATVHRSLLQGEEVKTAKVRKAAHRLQHGAQANAEQDVPGAYPHVSIRKLRGLGGTRCRGLELASRTLWLDVLVDVEEVFRVVPLLDVDQPVVVALV